MKINVAVLFGGKSVEHEISVISALQAAAAFDSEKYNVIPIYITKQNELYTGGDIGSIEAYKDIAKLLAASRRIILINNGSRVEMLRYPIKAFGNNIINHIDVAFPIVHGQNVEDGVLQGYLQTLGIPYVGCGVLASAVGMDKYAMKAVFKDNGIPVLDCLRFSQADFEAVNVTDEIEARFSYPVIVKPINLGSSIGINRADNRESLYNALSLALGFSEKVLVEPAIENLKEINCAVLGDSDDAIASECEEPVNTDEILSYNDKYISGAKDSGSKGMASTKRKIPADISGDIKAEIQSLAVKAFKALGCCGVSRIDFLMDTATNKVWLNEINTIPGSLAFYLWEASGIKYSELLERMIALAFKKQRRQEDIVYSFETNVLSGVRLGGKKGSKL